MDSDCSDRLDFLTAFFHAFHKRFY